jgi:dihydrodipicolinate synthase/N-acetylneuraminate lyase
MGSDSLYSRARLMGADGIVSGVAAAVPELLVSLERALCENNPERTRRLSDRVNEFIGWVDKFPATVAIKQAAVARGWKLDHSAVPFDGHTAGAVRAFEQWFRDWLPAVLAESAP